MEKLTLYEAVRLNLSEKAIMALAEAGELDTESGAERVLDNSTWLVIIPHDHEAMVKYGRGTRWDPANPRDSRYFDMYNQKGPFMIFINKETGEKYLANAAVDTVTDSKDRRVDPSELEGIPYELLSRLTKKNLFFGFDQ